RPPPPHNQPLARNPLTPSPKVLAGETRSARHSSGCVRSGLRPEPRREGSAPSRSPVPAGSEETLLPGPGDELTRAAGITGTRHQERIHEPRGGRPIERPALHPSGHHPEGSVHLQPFASGRHPGIAVIDDRDSAMSLGPREHGRFPAIVFLTGEGLDPFRQ